jgi:hypothetical protein
LIAAKAAIIGLVPGTIIAAIIAAHITNSSSASSGVHTGFIAFIGMFMSRRIAASIASISCA